MKRMARCQRARVRRLVDQHRVHGPNIGSREALDVVKDLQCSPFVRKKKNRFVNGRR